MQLKMIELKTETVILLNCTFKNNFQQTINVDFMLWIYCQKSIHHTTYKASISKACLCDQILNDHF